jgi:hypothetical protein
VNDRTETELLDLIQWLGPGSAFLAAKANKNTPFAYNKWGHIENLLLSIVNLIQHQTYVLRQINNPKKEKVPDPVSGPSGQTPAKKRNDANDMAKAQIQAIRAAKAGAQKGG